MANYLVTGGAGFVGSNIVERLVGLGHKVRVVDNLSTGKIENLNGFINNIEFIEGDLAEYEVAEKAAKGMDFVLHQAALSSVAFSIENPVAVNKSIVNSTVNLLKAAADSGTIQRVVQASSASVYGDSLDLPKSENMPPNPLSPYAAAKLAQEYYGKVFYNIYGLEVISLRYFNVFGPRQDPRSPYSGVISIFMSRMLQGQRPIIYGDGENSRDFVFVDNIVEANILASSCILPGTPEVINIGSGKSITLNQLVAKLNQTLNTDILPEYRDTRIGDIKHSVSDITKARELLGYSVKVDIDEALKRLVDWCKRAE